jgi:hypothetical protein
VSVDDRLRDDVGPAQELDLDAVFAAIDATSSGPLDRLRSASTPVRAAVALGWMCAVSLLVVAWLGPRELDTPVMLGALALLLPGAVVAIHVLRPLHRAPLRLPALGAALMFGLTVLLTFGGLLPGMPVTPEPSAPIHLHCGLWTLVVSGGLVLGILAVERGGGSAPWRLAGAAFAVGAAAFGVQTLICPVVDPVHLATAHAAGGVAVWPVLLAARALLRASSGTRR